MTTTTMSAAVRAVITDLDLDPAIVNLERVAMVLAEHLAAAERRGRVDGLAEYAAELNALAADEPEGSMYYHDLSWRAADLRHRAGMFRWPGDAGSAPHGKGANQPAES